MTRLCLVLLLVFSQSVSADEALSNDEVFKFFAEESQVVTATKFKTGLKETPASVTVITADEIARSGYRTLGEALQGVAGLYVNSDRSYEFLGVRGFNVLGDWSSRVLILVDGITTNDPLYGSGYVGNELGVELDAVKRIEVVMGPGSAIYGTHAMFAVINVITKNGEDLKGGVLSGGYGTGDLKDMNAAFGDKIPNGPDYYLQLSALGSNGLDHYVKEYDAVTKGTDYEGAFKSLAKFSYQDFSAEAGVNYRRKGLVNTAGFSIFGDDRSNQIDQGDFIQAQLKHSFSPTLDASVSLAHRNYSYVGRYMSDYGYLEEYISEAETKSVVGQLQVNWQPFDADWLTVGAEQQNNYVMHLKAYDKGFLDSANRYVYLDDLRQMKAWSVYAQNIYKPLDGFSLILGGRVDDYSTFGRTVNPRAGVLYTFLDSNTLKLLYGRAFNSPNNYALYYNDGGLTTLDNPGLQPETLESIEVVYEKEFSQALVSLSGFQNTVKDLIVSVADPNTLVSQYQNKAAARTQGVELKAKAEWKGLRVKLGAVYQRTVDTATDEDLSNSPRDTANASLSVPCFSRRLYLTLDQVYVGLRGTPWESWLSPYTRSDLTLYSAGLLPHLELTFKVRNLADLEYSDPSSGGDQFDYTQDRRNYYAKASFTF